MDAKLVAAFDEQWQKDRKVPAALAGVLSNAAARFLSDVVKQDQLYREILVADRHGRVVAASGRDDRLQPGGRRLVHTGARR